MYTTPLFAQLWGPVLLAVGLGFFFSKKYYVTIYRDLEKESFAVLFFGMFAMVFGMLHVAMHNSWNTFTEILISLLGWSLLLKGIICVTFPGVADRGGNWVLKEKMIPVVGIVILVVGAYLSWVGYFI